MKKTSLIIILSLASLAGAFGTVSAQTLHWPVAGKPAGEDILSKPQAYIGQEQNFTELFIGAEPGAVVLCPVDGIVLSVGASYYKSLSFVLSAHYKEGLSLTENVLAARQEDGLPYTGAISLRMADGNKLHLGGFIGDRHFKTGEKLSAGDTLGVVDYSYHAFKEPSLMVSISDRSNKPTDPMTPFGIDTTFKAPEEMTRENPLPADKVREDLTVLEEAICELYPSLEDRMGETALRAYMDSVKASVTEPMDVPVDFRILLRKVLHQLPDSHIGLYPDPLQTTPPPAWTPGEFLAFCDDTVRILLTVPAYTQYEGRVVSRINGAPAADYAKRMYELLSMYDDGVESTLEEECVPLGRYGMIMNPGARKGAAHELVFDDGTSVTIPFSDHTRFKGNDAYRRMARWHNINRMESDDDVFQTRMLNDSTAYLGIKTFEMLTGQVERVRDYLDSLQTPHLIVDVRNNSGGRSEALMDLLSCLAAEPMDRQKGGYGRVNKRGQFASLAHSLNYMADVDIFPEYEPGENGFYLRDTLETCSVVLPDPDVHYAGKVYVLTNGSSFSAATLFPAVLVRNRRGVSVGRETGTGYHYMTALKFADIQLPNSLQSIRIPMVQMVFDTAVCERLPEGRGLLPDYPVPLTYKEVMSGTDGEADVMLEYALSLIAEGRYLSEDNPFAAIDQASAKPVNWTVLLISALVFALLACLITLLLRKRRR